jgi:hypothetical protein
LGGIDPDSDSDPDCDFSFTSMPRGIGEFHRFCRNNLVRIGGQPLFIPTAVRPEAPGKHNPPF